MEQKAKDETVVLKLNKATKTFTNIPFEDTSCLPVTLHDEELNVKALVDFCDEINEFVCDLDDKPYEGLIYLAKDYNPDSKEVKVIGAYFTINGKVILDGTCEWQVSEMQGKIYSMIREEEPITSVVIANVHDTKAAVINELIGLIVIQDNISDTGLKELILGDWNISEPLDNSVLQSLASKCKNPTLLSVVETN